MYKVTEIFYSLQGEGSRAGSANIFIRFAGCNLTCNFCDTEFESFREFSLEGLLAEMDKFPCLNVIFTGGEPLMQLDEPLVQALQAKNYFIAVETNGTQKAPAGIDFICCSPKVAEHVVAKNFPEGVQELRYVRHSGQGIPQPKIHADHYYVSPQSTGDKINQENLRHCIDLCLTNPLWKLSVQQHKIWRVL